MRPIPMNNFIKYNPHIGDKLGKGASLFLGALQFFLNNKEGGLEKEGVKWVYNTVEQWAKYLGYSTRQVERIISQLSRQGIIRIEKLNRFKANRTNYYTINEESLARILQEATSAEQELSKKSLSLSFQDSSLALDKMSGCSRPSDGFISKKTNKKNINNKSDKSKETKVTSSPPLSPNREEKLTPITLPSVHKKPYVALELVEIWNKINENAKAIMTKSLAPLCIAAFKKKFDADLKKWEVYCRKIASSSYLSGKDFHLSIYWALKYSVIDRIEKGEFGVKDIPLSLYSHDQALDHIYHLNEPDRCKEIRLKILKIYGEKTYKDWFEDLHLEVINNNVCFKAKNKFMKDFISTKFREFISPC